MKTTYKEALEDMGYPEYAHFDKLLDLLPADIQFNEYSDWAEFIGYKGFSRCFDYFLPDDGFVLCDECFS